MTHAINVTVRFEADVNHVQAERLSAMDNVPVLVNTGSDSYSYNFSRVPTVGEHVKINGDIYTVRSVTHTPTVRHAAEITVSLANHP